MQYHIGQLYVLGDRGVVRLDTQENGVLTFTRADDATYQLKEVEASGLLRPIASEEEAKQSLLLLKTSKGEPIDDEQNERALLYEKKLRGGAFAEQVGILKSLYAHPSKVYPEKHARKRYEELILREIAHVLGFSFRMLKAEVREAAMGEKPPPSLTLPDRKEELARHEPIPSFSQPDFRPIGAFAVESTIAIGEGGYGHREAASPGVWYAYAHDNEHWGALDQLVAVHADFIIQVTTLRDSAEILEELPIDGASMAIIDAAFIEDEAFRIELDDGAEGIVLGRGVQVSLQGDGMGRAHVARSDDHAVLVWIDML